MCSCAPFVGHIPPMSLQNPKLPSKLKRAKMADEAELFCISDSKTVVFARLLVSVNDLHRGLSSSVFRVEQMTQNQVPQGVPVRVRPPAPRCRSEVRSVQNPAAQNELPDFSSALPCSSFSTAARCAGFTVWLFLAYSRSGIPNFIKTQGKCDLFIE